MQKKLLTSQDVADRLGKGRQRINQLALAGELPEPEVVFEKGNGLTRLWSEKSIEKYLLKKRNHAKK